MLSFEAARVPRLPSDILYLVAQFSTFETRASLVRCNRWLHQNCTSLLFKDIYLHSPRKLIELLINEEAMNMLSRTDSIYLDESILAFDSWPSRFIKAAPDLIVSLLRAANSLSRLQVYRFIEKYKPEDLSHKKINGDYAFHSKLGQKLKSAASNPAFLANLAILIDYPDTYSFGELCPGRPVIYHYYNSEPDMYVDICPSFATPGPRPNLKHSLSAHDVGVLIRESGYSSRYRPGGRGIRIFMRFPEEIKRKVLVPVQDTVSWTKTMLEASEITFLCRLVISFEPEPPYLSITAQLDLVEELYEEFPELEDISISYPRFLWSRSEDHEPHESRYFPEDPLPEWTPDPDESYMSDWMDWWLDALGLDSQEPRNLEEVTQIAEKLVDGIRLRWEFPPTHEALVNYLTSNKLRPD